MMKRLWRKLSALALGAMLLAGALTVGAGAAEVTSVTVEMRPNVTILVDGVERTFYNVQGQEVHPLYYQGTHYLPVRAIGELMGKEVSWNGATRTITLSGGSLVTDADTFGPSGTGTTTPSNPGSSGTGSSGGLISAEEAQAKALAHAGLTSSQVTFVRSHLEWDDGRQVYDVEFYTKDYQEYDYEIDARTGAVLSFDQDAEFYQPQTSTGSYIGKARAKSIALNAAGLSESQVSHIRCYLDRDDGRWEYSVEFWSGTMEYEYEIDAYSGAILSRDMDSIYD